MLDLRQTGCAVGRNRISLMSTSSGSLTAKATVRAKVSALTAILLTNSLVPAWMSFSLICSRSSVLTAPGEMIGRADVVGLHFLAQPFGKARTANLVAQ